MENLKEKSINCNFSLFLEKKESILISFQILRTSIIGKDFSPIEAGY